jgi:hypothetical protein
MSKDLGTYVQELFVFVFLALFLSIFQTTKKPYFSMIVTQARLLDRPLLKIGIGIFKKSNRNLFSCMYSIVYIVY